MSRRDEHSRNRLPLTIGLAASLALHALVIVPIFLVMISPRGEAASLEVRYGSDDIQPAPEAAPPPPLGLDAPNPSSLTWIGYEEYQEHLAALEAFDQAAFTQEPVGQAGHVESLIVEEPAEQDEPAERLAEAAQDEPSQPSPPIEVVEAVEAPDSPRGAPELLALLSLLEALHEAPIIPADESQARTGESAQPPTESNSTARTTPAAPDSAAEAAPAAAGEAADAADKESPPTSTIEVPPENWRMGKPLAAQGIELKPQRPRFSIVQLLTASPGNPLVDIRFRRDGVPALVTLVRSTGVESVDATLLASLYRWRAAGAALEELEGDQTFTVRIHIILTRRG